MNRVTHKEIEERGLIVHHQQQRAYEWLKTQPNVWFMDGPVYTQVVTTEIPFLNETKLVHSTKSHPSYTHKVSFTYESWDSQSCNEGIINYFDKQIKSIGVNDLLVVYLMPNEGLWFSFADTYDSSSFERKKGMELGVL